MAENFDVTVIGGGPGGYVAAIRAAQLGLNVCLVEKEKLGGVCLNWGCIPTKALLESAHLLQSIRKAETFGLNVTGAIPDFPAIIKRSRGVADTMANGVDFLMKKNKISVKKGSAVFKDNHTIWLPDSSKEEIHSEFFIIATGARPRELPDLSFDGERVLSSKHAMIQEGAPKSLAIIGAGAIGAEFADFYSTMGTDITLIELQDRILPLEDSEISNLLNRSFVKRGIKILTNVGVTEPKLEANGVSLLLKGEGLPANGERQEFSKVLVAIGVVPNTEGLFLEEVGVFLQKGFIKVDTKYKSKVPNIYGIGDCIGAPLLAHVASMEGVKAAEAISIVKGNPHNLVYEPVDYGKIPACTYCHPEVASVGYKEEEAKKAGFEIATGKFPFRVSGRAQALGDTEGMVKLVADKKTGEILGAHLIGPNVTELLGEINLGIGSELTLKEIAGRIHAHPTLSEALMEAAAQGLGEAINL
ncbi:dihydrolipoyl dehydrogenase [Leptospira inadai serovar Lyme str. 10]|uniref:Dihydrolipoyl dehydrogenase n=2 Tax=Leptospira inadai serovar Lyme TaxID=293084 RepID=V6HF35_9LEPT|nr:dihydrolipoyl dehydrogenase [Leptospira inadai]EQA38128.1 dihydrolipoyl dehydrogenase [Leptospira inadai serovar Lyme str. 10]PNV73341.1 dihydrolipoyl dehydrogenase [Leptospira inadai serovar Lyme]